VVVVSTSSSISQLNRRSVRSLRRLRALALAYLQSAFRSPMMRMSSVFQSRSTAVWTSISASISSTAVSGSAWSPISTSCCTAATENRYTIRSCILLHSARYPTQSTDPAVGRRTFQWLTVDFRRCVQHSSCEVVERWLHGSGQSVCQSACLIRAIILRRSAITRNLTYLEMLLSTKPQKLPWCHFQMHILPLNFHSSRLWPWMTLNDLE